MLRLTVFLAGATCVLVGNAGAQTNVITREQHVGFSSPEGVEKTWARCAALVQRPEVAASLKLSGERIRRFVQAFPAMQQAYAEKAMSYGMFIARR